MIKTKHRQTPTNKPLEYFITRKQVLCKASKRTKHRNLLRLLSCVHSYIIANRCSAWLPLWSFLRSLIESSLVPNTKRAIRRNSLELVPMKAYINQATSRAAYKRLMFNYFLNLQQEFLLQPKWQERAASFTNRFHGQSILASRTSRSSFRVFFL